MPCVGGMRYVRFAMVPFDALAHVAVELKLPPTWVRAVA
jgi:hypothetical protein